MILFAKHTTPRLEWIAEWLGTQLHGSPLEIITIEARIKEQDFVLNYTDQPLQNTNSFWIKPHALLFETSISHQNITVSIKNNLPYFFETEGDFYFDFLAASFYLLQRYEEYLPHNKDIYGRYAHQNSIAYKNHFLHLPLVDLWVNELRQVLPTANRQPPAAKYLPTYDIDIAYSYRGKGFVRNMAGAIRTFGQWNLLKERWQVLLEKKQDPFDIFQELDALHYQHQLQPLYFFLLAKQIKGYDKNINSATQEMKQLIRDIAAKYTTGIHPSWQSGDDESLLQTEIETLQFNNKKNVSISRQHYVRMQLPGTYQHLISHGITAEYSMGYGSINGFRASTCVPYYWYNLQKEQVTVLKIFPFCYMEANSIFEQKDTPAKALKELQEYYNVVKKVGGMLITIFHNHLIGLDENGKEWMAMYRQFFKYHNENK